MKKLLFLLLIIGCFSFSYAQSQAAKSNQVRNITETSTKYKMVLNYTLDATKIQQAQEEITQLLGPPIGNKLNWSVSKNSDQYLTVKILNNSVFVRGADSSPQQSLKEVMIQLDSKLSVLKY